MREAIASGRFGNPVQVVGVAGQHFPTYRPAYREIYYASRAAGGGAIQDALTHLINAAEWLVGPVTQLAADAAHLVLPGVDVEDTVHVLARHSKILASYSLNQHQAPNEFSLTVVCERGALRFDPYRAMYHWMTEPGTEWRDEPFPPIERDQLFILQAERFLDSVDGTPPICSLADGEQTLRVNLGVLASVESHAWVNI
jgi:predicted dehydrogenase